MVLLVDEYWLAVERIIDGIIRFHHELRVNLGLGSHDLGGDEV